jgi:large subunit ribosomal protein L30e
VDYIGAGSVLFYSIRYGNKLEMPKKATTESINAQLTLVMKSGKVLMGYKQTLKALRRGEVKMVLISSNCPKLRKTELEYYCVLSKAAIYNYSGTNLEMGSAIGRLHKVCSIAIIKEGDSDILKVAA